MLTLALALEVEASSLLACFLLNLSPFEMTNFLRFTLKFNFYSLQLFQKSKITHNTLLLEFFLKHEYIICYLTSSIVVNNKGIT